MKEDDHDKLWELLGKAREPRQNPFFARNTLREIRSHENWWTRLWRRPTLAPALGAALAALLLLLGVWSMSEWQQQPAFATGGPRSDPAAAEAPADLDILLQLDELLAYEENLLWLDQSPL